MSFDAGESWELLSPEMEVLMGLVSAGLALRPLSIPLAWRGSDTSQEPLGTTMSRVTRGPDTTHLCPVSQRATPGTSVTAKLAGTVGF